MADVRLDELRKTYDDVVAVDHLCLTVHNGEFFSLLGPSGCGKSTTLRLVAGLETPTAGRLWFGDQDVTQLPPYRRHIGMVFQNYALFPHLNVRENVAYGLRAQRTPRRDIGALVDNALHRVELDGYAERGISELSGGQQQRVALARSLVLSPQLFLLDEPLSNLDAALRVSTRAEMRRFQRKEGITTVYVTHDQDEALALSDRIAVMRSGRLQQVGTPQELYNQPANAFVATFLGRANLAPVTVVNVADHGGAIRLADFGFDYVPGNPITPGPALLCVRPENLQLADAGLPATVVDVAYLGSRWEILLNLPGDLQWLATLPNIGPQPPQTGQSVHFTFDPQMARLLPPEESDR